MFVFLTFSKTRPGKYLRQSALPGACLDTRRPVSPQKKKRALVPFEASRHLTHFPSVSRGGIPPSSRKMKWKKTNKIRVSCHFYKQAGFRPQAGEELCLELKAGEVSTYPPKNILWSHSNPLAFSPHARLQLPETEDRKIGENRGQRVNTSLSDIFKIRPRLGRVQGWSPACATGRCTSK